MDESSANAMGKFLYKFKKLTFDMANSGNDGRMELHSPLSGRRRLLPKSTALLPYWKHLGDALLSSRFMACVAFNEHSSFHISNIQLASREMDMLARGLARNSFRTVWFDCNHFGKAGIRQVMYGIEHNDQLETLFLMNNPIRNSQNVDRFCSIIKHKPSLKRLVIRNCGGEENASILYPIITASSTLERLEIDGNGISSLGSTGLSDFLISNTSLTSLQLQGNQLNDGDAVLIANALESNTTLRDLDLSSNPITNAGKEALLKRIFDPESLNTVTDCNHTCQVRVHAAFDEDRELPQINGMYGHPKSDRQMNLHSLYPNIVKNMKVLAMLSAPYEKVVNIQYLDGLPLELVPNVLEFLQQYPDQYYDFPDGHNTHNHWHYLSALRPDTPQNESEANTDDNNNEEENDEQEEVEGDDEGNWHDYDVESWPSDHDSQQVEMDPKPAQIKRLNVVYEIMRGWKMDTGEPLYVFASSY